MKHYTLRSDIADNSFNKLTKYVKQCQYYTLYKNTFQQKPTTYGNQSTDLESKSINWLPYDTSLHRDVLPNRQ